MVTFKKKFYKSNKIKLIIKQKKRFKIHIYSKKMIFFIFWQKNTTALNFKFKLYELKFSSNFL